MWFIHIISIVTKIFSVYQIVCVMGYNMHSFQRGQWHPTPVLLPGKSHGRRSLVPAVHGVAKSWTRLSDFTFTFHFHALEKEMATHSSILAWRIPGTGEPRGLLSIGSHRVRHDWSDLAAAAAADLGMTGAKITTLQSVNVDQLNFWFEGDLEKEG